MFDLEHRTVGQIDAVGVDEIQYAKGHKHLTLVYQFDPGVIWAFTFLKQHVGTTIAVKKPLRTFVRNSYRRSVSCTLVIFCRRPRSEARLMASMRRAL